MRSKTTTKQDTGVITDVLQLMKKFNFLAIIGFNEIVITDVLQPSTIVKKIKNEKFQ